MKRKRGGGRSGRGTGRRPAGSGCAGRGAARPGGTGERNSAACWRDIYSAGGAEGPRGPSAPRIGCPGSTCDRGGRDAAPPLPRLHPHPLSLSPSPHRPLQITTARGCAGGGSAVARPHRCVRVSIYLYTAQAPRTRQLLEQSVPVRSAARGAEPRVCGGGRRPLHRTASRRAAAAAAPW